MADMTEAELHSWLWEMKRGGEWRLHNVEGEPTWVWHSNEGWLAMVSDEDFDILIERNRTSHLTLDDDGYPRLNNGGTLQRQLLGVPMKDTVWESVNGNRRDVRLCNVALVEHTQNVEGAPGVHFDGQGYWGAVHGRRVGKRFDSELDAYLAAVGTWVNDWNGDSGREYARKNTELFDEENER